MTSPLCKCLVGKTIPGQRCAKQGSGDFQQQGRKRNWFALAPAATRLETCCLWPDPVFRHCWLIFWPIPAVSRISPALHTQSSMFFPQQVSACRICSTFTGPAATRHVEGHPRVCPLNGESGAGGSFGPFQVKTTMSWESDGVVLRPSRQSFPWWLNFLQLGHGVRGFFSSGHPHCPSLIFLQL